MAGKNKVLTDKMIFKVAFESMALMSQLHINQEVDHSEFSKQDS